MRALLISFVALAMLVAPSTEAGKGQGKPNSPGGAAAHTDKAAAALVTAAERAIIGAYLAGPRHPAAGHRQAGRPG